MPRVSIVIPTYNLAHYIGRTLASVFSQTYTDYEVIVADDGSTDDTQKVLTPWDGQIHYLYQSNKGVASARNLALSKASGELIAYVDADDMWYPHKLERQVTFLDAHRQYGLVHSELSVIDATDQIIRSRFNQETGRVVPQGHCTMDLLRWCHIEPLTVMERRECIERTGGFDERLKGTDDYLRWILVAMNGIAFGYIDEPLAMNRSWGDRFSVRHFRSYCEAFVTLFEILLHEKALELHCGREAVDVVRGRLYTAQRDLAYLDRVEGQTQRARRLLVNLIREWPLRPELYLDMLKTAVPPVMAAKLRDLRAQARVNKSGRS